MDTHPLTLWRQRVGKSRADLAAELGVTRWAVGLWERGKRRPRHETIGRLVSMSGGRLTFQDFLNRASSETNP